MKASDRQVGGDYYKQFAIEPTRFAHENNLPFIDGCIIKYVCRHSYKNGKEDLEKAIHYLELLLEWDNNIYTLLDSLIKCIKKVSYVDKFKISVDEFLAGNNIYMEESVIISYVCLRREVNGKEYIHKAIKQIKMLIEKEYGN